MIQQFHKKKKLNDTTSSETFFVLNWMMKTDSDVSGGEESIWA